MDFLAHLIFSLEGFFLFIFALVSVFLFFWIPLQRKKTYSPLLDFFKAKFHLPLGTISFHFFNSTFYISRIAVGSISLGSQGSYPVLWASLQKSPEFILGHRESKKYCRLRFSKAQEEVLTLGDQHIFLSSSDMQMFDQIKLILTTNPQLFSEMLKLFTRDFDHLTVNSARHIKGFKIKRLNVLRYIALSEEIYEKPEILNEQLIIISAFIDKLGIKIKNETGENALKT